MKHVLKDAAHAKADILKGDKEHAIKDIEHETADVGQLVESVAADLVGKKMAADAKFATDFVGKIAKLAVETLVGKQQGALLKHVAKDVAHAKADIKKGDKA